MLDIDIEGFAREIEQMPPDFADLPGRDTVKRGLEIAAAGRHRIALVGDAGEVELFTRALDGIGGEVEVVEVDDAEVVVVVERPGSAERELLCESSDAVRVRVERARRRARPQGLGAGDARGETLLQAARNRWQLDETAFDALRAKLLAVAASIARLDGASSIGAEHVAEAIRCQAARLGEGGGDS